MDVGTVTVGGWLSLQSWVSENDSCLGVRGAFNARVITDSSFCSVNRGSAPLTDCSSDPVVVGTSFTSGSGGVGTFVVSQISTGGFVDFPAWGITGDSIAHVYAWGVAAAVSAIRKV